MLNVIGVCVSIISMVCCIVCVIRIKEVKQDRAEILNNWLKTVNDFGRSVDLNTEVINHCKILIKNNESLADINADLRLEFYKMKENNNA